MVRPLKSLASRSLRSIVPIVYALMSAIPLLIFLLCMVHFQLLDEPFAQFSIAGYLAFSLYGYIILRQMVTRVISLSAVTPPVSGGSEPEPGGNELNRLAVIFSDLIVRLEGTTEHLEKRMRELRSIGEITELTSRITDMGQLFETVLEKAMATLGASRGVILSVSRDNSTMRAEVMRGKPDMAPEDIRLPVDDTIVGRPVREHRVLVTADPAREKHFKANVDAGFADGPLLAIPINARGAVIGVLVLSRGKYSPQFDEPEIQYATTILSQTAFAFNNAQLVRELKSACSDLKHARNRIVASERIAAINQTVVTLSDKINSPLTVIKGHIEIIRRLLNSDEEGVRRSLDMIDSSVGRCVDIMTRLSKIQDHVISPYPGDDRMIDIDNAHSSSGKKTGLNHPVPGAAKDKE